MDWKALAIPFASNLSSLFAIVDPFAVIPVFISITDRYSKAERQVLIKRSSLIAAAILGFFALSGEAMFHLFGISIPAFRIAGGILLLQLGIEQLGATRERVKSEEEHESFARDDVSIFPLATPLLAGPGAISTVVLQASQSQEWYGSLLLLLAIGLVFVATYIILSSAPHVFHLLGRTGLNLLTRLMGIILTAIAVQFVIDGVMGVWKLGSEAMGQTVHQRSFEVRDAATDELYFQGTESYKHGERELVIESRYFDLDKRPTHREYVALQRPSLELIRYEYEAFGLGERAEIQSDGKQLNSLYRSDSKAAESRMTFPLKDKICVGQSIVALMEHHWATLKAGQALSCSLLLPQRSTSIDFEISLDSKPSDIMPDLLNFQARPKNFLLRLLAPKVELHFRAKDPAELKVFAGPSPTPIKGKSNRPLRIFYSDT